ncbi:hypothetical protein [Winogradskyella sp. UBA3174]|uniref:hypothetical protein n=1 Tax=Winogradskyella sp. UBA3174 TaxID=1947785 RepID=UPI0025E7FD35|nr:hypothetical protein [Winogradskyella sp. UBA3174]
MNIKAVIASVFRALAIMLVFVVLTPSVIKLMHVFNHHEHEVCLGESSSHLHTSDFDCDFYKFKLTTAFFFEIQSFTLEQSEISSAITSHYIEVNKNNQYLTYLLRGPPSLV